MKGYETFQRPKWQKAKKKLPLYWGKIHYIQTKNATGTTVSELWICRQTFLSLVDS